MTKSQDNTIPKHYFVDEAGDSTIFDRKGNVIVGTEGCSRFFVLGYLDVPDPELLSKELTDLRLRLLSDPYFKNVPSFSPSQKKTAHAFHAKDDLPEVRREVMAVLRQQNGLRFYAALVDKLGYAQYVKNLNAKSAAYRYNPNELYDQLTKRLFKDKIHKSDRYDICFARRGRSDRTQALKQALIETRNKYSQTHKIQTSASLNVTASDPPLTVSLQAVDYFLWALQRLYEKQEERYLEYIWPAFGQVIDINDLRNAKTGAYYSQKKPLTLSAIHGRL